MDFGLVIQSFFFVCAEIMNSSTLFRVFTLNINS